MMIPRLTAVLAAAALLAAGAARADEPSAGRCQRTEPMGSFSYDCDTKVESVRQRTEPLGSFAYGSDERVKSVRQRTEPLGSFGYASDQGPADRAVGEKSAVARK